MEENVPAEHVVHEDAVVGLALYFPLSHAKHSDVSEFEWVPAPHVSHSRASDR